MNINGYEYKDVDFKSMTFNVYGMPPSADLFKTFPILEAYEEFYGLLPGLNKKHAILYMFYAYDKESPVVKRNKDNNSRRKLEAAQLAGFELKDGNRFSEAVEGMMIGKNSSFNKMVCRFLKIQADHDVSYLMVLTDAFYKELPNIQGGELKNLDKVNTIKKKMEELERVITVNDNSRFLIDDLYKFLEEEQRIHLRPEDVALAIKNGSDPFEGKMTW